MYTGLYTSFTYNKWRSYVWLFYLSNQKIHNELLIIKVFFRNEINRKRNVYKHIIMFIWVPYPPHPHTHTTHTQNKKQNKNRYDWWALKDFNYCYYKQFNFRQLLKIHNGKKYGNINTIMSDMRTLWKRSTWENNVLKRNRVVTIFIFIWNKHPIENKTLAMVASKKFL